MSPEEYQAAALRTRSSQFYPDRVPPEALYDVLEQIAVHAEALDAYKRVLFYGKPPDTLPAYAADVTDIQLGRIDPDLLHSVIGMATEVGEMIEAVLSVLRGEEPDVVNLKEEFGDKSWYQALGLHALGTGFEAIWEANIRKLTARYPERFTTDHALGRDLARERDVLEGRVEGGTG